MNPTIMMIEVAREAYANGDLNEYPSASGMEAAITAALALLPGEPTAELPADIMESLLAIGYVEWGQTHKQKDGKHLDDLEDTLRITRQHFCIEDKETAIHGLYLADTSIVLAHTGMSPNSPQHARILAGAWNQLVDIARGKVAAPAPQPVSVKALEWAEIGEALHWIRAHTPIGLVYNIEDDGFSAKKHHVTVGQLVLGNFDNIDEAKYAAQSDYETRIRSALIGGDV